MRDLKQVLARHLDPEGGSTYWLERQARLGFDLVREISGPEDFPRLGPMSVADLRARPLDDFVPRSLQPRCREMILAETGGTLGPPCRRVYLPEEFERAFVAPWARAAARRAFPTGVQWLWLGPGGPHVIGQAARAMARQLGSLEPFTVDCDPRWVRRQAPGSLGHRLYLEHLLDQAVALLARESIGVLFTTPPLLEALVARMTLDQRAAIRGVHLGGMPVSADICRRARTEWFPRSVVIPGYGNSLFGVAFEIAEPRADHAPCYHVDDEHLWLQVAPIAPDCPQGVDLHRALRPEERGRVVVHRLDASFLLINCVERDEATVAPAVPATAARGRYGFGLRDVRPAEAAAPAGAGIY